MLYVILVEFNETGKRLFIIHVATYIHIENAMQGYATFSHTQKTEATKLHCTNGFHGNQNKN